tara:strand:+ start:718 stop:918 length:201 start_codon:yes stop_codon:yes gene_type:complete
MSRGDPERMKVIRERVKQVVDLWNPYPEPMSPGYSEAERSFSRHAFEDIQYLLAECARLESKNRGR